LSEPESDASDTLRACSRSLDGGVEGHPVGSMRIEVKVDGNERPVPEGSIRAM
jgi:hypothetical protein